MATELEKATKGGKSLDKAVVELLPKVIKENKRILFNGNNYSKEWEKEAGKRGLLNLKNTVDALPQLISKESHRRVREVQGPERARAALALRHHGRDLQQDRERRRSVDGPDRESLHPAGRTRVPEAGRAERVGGESGRRASRPRARSCSPRSTKLTDEFKKRTDKLQIGARPSRAATRSSTRSTSAMRSFPR